MTDDCKWTRAKGWMLHEGRFSSVLRYLQKKKKSLPAEVDILNEERSPVEVLRKFVSIVMVNNLGE